MDCETPIRQTSVVNRQSQVRIAVLTDAVRVRELIRVLRAFEEVGAMPVVFKGAALAHTHYADSWRRPRYDSDVLIALESRSRVCAILQELGYERRTFVSGDLVMYQVPFERVDHLGIDHEVDVHWRVANPQVVSQLLTHDELVDRCVTVRVQDHPMRVPSPVDALLLACVHRVAHHPNYEKPIWVQDIHLLAARLDASEWRTFVERTTDRSVRAICLEGLRLAQARFQTQVPLDVLRDLAAAHNEPSAIFLRADVRPVDRLASDLRALGPRAAAHLMREHLFPPAEYMQAAYGVRSRALLPVYYAARVWSGVFKWFRAA
jgi:Uncharacterised nucleotidyltransferase